MESLDPRECYRVVAAKDRSRSRDFVYAVRTTGVVCKPGCRSRTPLPENVEYFHTLAEALESGFRPCKRCRPDAIPGSRRDDPEAFLAHEAMTLIEQGVVDEVGVAGLAQRLSVSERHLSRIVMRHTGATPQQHAIMRRTTQARDLIGSTDWPVRVIAASAGFRSVRHLRETLKAVLGTTARQMRQGRREGE
jgi:AraC family transcriptional regulator, regulatory protein of adaptative response / DNA-3-methyladenine glycosylase II